jgi:acyl-coenzyme A synthetase/AMP-(fatty) acid ligase
LTYEEAVAAVTAPGQQYETERIVVDGVELTEFRNVPRSLQEHVGERLAAFKVPSRVFVLERQLPRNAAGKVLKRQLRDEVSSR